MADTKKSDLPAATTPLAGTEIIDIVQGGVNKRATINDVLANDTDPVTSVNGLSGGAVTLTQDVVGDGTTYKQYSQTEKTKLAGIATGATANDTDANLKNRANHTGSQAISTVTGLQTALDGKFTQRTITGTANQITVTNGDGVSGNPTLSLPSAITTPGTLTTTGVLSPSADSTYTLGTSSLYWSNTYTDRLYLNSTAYLDGGTAGASSLVGRFSSNDSGPSSGSSDYTGFSQYLTCSGTYSGALYGGNLRVVRSVTGNWIIGYKFNPYLSGSASLTGKMTAFYAVPEHNSSGTIAEMYGAEVNPYITSTGGVTSYSGMYINQFAGAGTGTIGTFRGIYVKDPNKTVTGTAYGLYLGSITSGATNYAIYTNDGLVSFGGHTQPKTDSTYTLGTSSLYWSNTFTDRITINSTAYIDGASAGQLKVTGLFMPVQATTAGAPAYVKGAMYFDTTLNKLRIGGATAWETVTSV